MHKVNDVTLHRKMGDNELTKDDKIWLSHMEGREGKWLALAGDYPHTLVAEGENLGKVHEAAREAGYLDAMFFMVPPSYPICTTPFFPS